MLDHPAQDLLHSQVKKTQTALDRSQETVLDYEQTILEFRRLVQNLQNDIAMLRQGHSKGAEEHLSSQSQDMVSLTVQLQASALRAQSKSIELELRKLEAQQATLELSLIQVRAFYLGDCRGYMAHSLYGH